MSDNMNENLSLKLRPYQKQNMAAWERMTLLELATIIGGLIMLNKEPASGWHAIGQLLMTRAETYQTVA